MNYDEIEDQMSMIQIVTSICVALMVVIGLWLSLIESNDPASKCEDLYDFPKKIIRGECKYRVDHNVWVSKEDYIETTKIKPWIKRE